MSMQYRVAVPLVRIRVLQRIVLPHPVGENKFVAKLITVRYRILVAHCQRLLFDGPSAVHVYSVWVVWGWVVWVVWGMSRVHGAWYTVHSSTVQ
jgi:hypothetical protein